VRTGKIRRKVEPSSLTSYRAGPPLIHPICGLSPNGLTNRISQFVRQHTTSELAVECDGNLKAGSIVLMQRQPSASMILNCTTVEVSVLTSNVVLILLEHTLPSHPPTAIQFPPGPQLIHLIPKPGSCPVNEDDAVLKVPSRGPNGLYT
jgi:hypothetical protein